MIKLEIQFYERQTLFFQTINIRLPGDEPAMVLWYMLTLCSCHVVGIVVPIL